MSGSASAAPFPQEGRAPYTTAAASPSMVLNCAGCAEAKAGPQALQLSHVGSTLDPPLFSLYGCKLTPPSPGAPYPWTAPSSLDQCPSECPPGEAECYPTLWYTPPASGAGTGVPYCVTLRPDEGGVTATVQATTDKCTPLQSSTFPRLVFDGRGSGQRPYYQVKATGDALSVTALTTPEDATKTPESMWAEAGYGPACCTASAGTDICKVFALDKVCLTMAMDTLCNPAGGGGPRTPACQKWQTAVAVQLGENPVAGGAELAAALEAAVKEAPYTPTDTPFVYDLMATSCTTWEGAAGTGVCDGALSEVCAGKTYDDLKADAAAGGRLWELCGCRIPTIPSTAPGGVPCSPPCRWEPVVPPSDPTDPTTACRIGAPPPGDVTCYFDATTLDVIQAASGGPNPISNVSQLCGGDCHVGDRAAQCACVMDKTAIASVLPTLRGAIDPEAQCGQCASYDPATGVSTPVSCADFTSAPNGPAGGGTWFARHKAVVIGGAVGGVLLLLLLLVLLLRR